MMSKGNTYSKGQHYNAVLYNEYFGSGLSSIVFQEIRESKALAYSAGTAFTVPMNQKPHYYRAYVGTQADKMKEAINAMKEIINNMPESHQQITAAINTQKRKLKVKEFRKNIFFTQMRNNKLGIITTTEMIFIVY